MVAFWIAALLMTKLQMANPPMATAPRAAAPMAMAVRAEDWERLCSLMVFSLLRTRQRWKMSIGLCEVGDADVARERGVLALEREVHLPGDAAIAEVAGGAGAQFGDVLGFGKVHFEKRADARGEREEVDGGLRGLGAEPAAMVRGGLVGGFNGGVGIRRGRRLRRGCRCRQEDRRSRDVS